MKFVLRENVLKKFQIRHFNCTGNQVVADLKKKKIN